MPSGYTIFKYPEDFFQIFPDKDYSQSISKSNAEEKEQIQYLFRYLKEIKCVSILMEKNYVDHDYLDDYANYYAKCFTDYKRFCRRAHFWSIDVSELDLEKIIVEKNAGELENLQECYLGFLTLKPLPNTVIGRTVIKTYDNEGKRHFPATTYYDVNLFGVELKAKSLAFQEQDKVLAACATTALWSSFQKTSRLFQTHTPTPVDITSKATKYIQTTRPVPSQGLIVEQICYAISEVGLTPEVQQIRKDTPINSLIYSYVNMGIPVILGYAAERNGKILLHAVTVCGYRLESDIQHDTEIWTPQLDINLIGRRISEFYVHDDTLGPFSRLKSAKHNNPECSKIKFIREALDSTCDCIPTVVIVPLYHKVRLTFNMIKGTIREFDSYLSSLGIKESKDANLTGFEWDIRLLKLSQLRKYVINNSDFDYETKVDILFRNMPRFCWISTARLSGTCLFSILSDATDMEKSFCLDELLFHIPELKANMSKIIKESDPNLEGASCVNLPAPFIKFISKTFLE